MAVAPILITLSVSAVLSAALDAAEDVSAEEASFEEAVELVPFELHAVSVTPARAAVSINDKKVTRNVNNRVYMLENKNLNIATNEAVTSYGTVSGMTFFGMYQLDRNNKVSTAFYNNKYNSGDTVASGEFYSFTAGSYVLGSHNTNHDITKDGFYSNYEDRGKPSC